MRRAVDRDAVRRVSDVAWEISQKYLKKARSQTAARCLWVTENDGCVTLWVATEPTSHEVELMLIDASQALVKAFPQTAFDVKVLNPNPELTQGDPTRRLPAEAQLVWER